MTRAEMAAEGVLFGLGAGADGTQPRLDGDVVKV
jgi:hypothetical protein